MATESATDGAVGDAAASEVDRLVALLADRDARIVELEGTVSTLRLEVESLRAARHRLPSSLSRPLRPERPKSWARAGDGDAVEKSPARVTANPTYDINALTTPPRRSVEATAALFDSPTNSPFRRNQLNTSTDAGFDTPSRAAISALHSTARRPDFPQQLPSLSFRPVPEFHRLVSSRDKRDADPDARGKNTSILLSREARDILVKLGCEVNSSPSITLAPACPVEMNALKRRIFEIPPNATHVSWCYGLTELPESVDDALSSKLDEAEDSGEAKPDTAALSLFRDGGFVYFNPDRSIGGALAVVPNPKNSTYQVRMLEPEALLPEAVTYLSDLERWRPVRELAFILAGATQWCHIAPHEKVPEVTTSHGAWAFRFKNDHEPLVFPAAVSSLASTGTSAFQRRHSSRRKKPRPLSTMTIRSLLDGGEAEGDADEQSLLYGAGGPDEPETADRPELRDRFARQLRLEAILRRASTSKKSRDVLCLVELRANVLTITDPAREERFECVIPRDVLPEYGTDEYGPYMDLTEILVSDGATAAGGGIPTMRLHHQSEQSDLLWKRALAIAAVLPSFEPDLFVTEAEVRHEKRMGKGAFGEVWRAFVNGSANALKQVEIKEDFDEGGGKLDPTEMVQFFTEAMLLLKIRHGCLLRLHHITFTPEKRRFSLITEFLDGGTLSQLLRDKDEAPLPRQSSKVLLRIWREFFSGVAYLHDNSIIHRDLKPDNIMMVRDVKYMDVDDFRDSTGHTFVKIVDFGQANVVSAQSQQLFQQQFRDRTLSVHDAALPNANALGKGWCTMTCRDRGTPVYRPPEMIPFDVSTQRFVARESKPYSIKADIYSASLIVWECWTRLRPFSVGDPARFHPIMLDKSIVQGLRPTIPEDCPPLLHALISRGWAGQPDLRPSASSVFQILSVDEHREDRNGASLLFPLEGLLKGFQDPAVVIKTVSHYAWKFLPEACREPMLETLRKFRPQLDDGVFGTIQSRRRTRDGLKERIREILVHEITSEDDNVSAIELPVLALGLLTAGRLESSTAVELIDCRRLTDFEPHNFSTVTLLQQLVSALCERGGPAVAATGSVVRVIADLGPSAVKLRAEAMSLWDVEALITTGFTALIERYDDEKSLGVSIRWASLFLDWIRCTCVLITAYLTFGDTEEMEGISALVLSSSIVPQTIAVAHELWTAVKEGDTVDSTEGPTLHSLANTIVYYAASLSRTVSKIPKFLAYSLAAYWLHWLEGLALDIEPHHHAVELKQFSTDSTPWEPKAIVIVLDAMLDALSVSDAHSLDGFISIGSLPTVIRWMHLVGGNLPVDMKLRGCKIVRQLLQGCLADSDCSALSDEEIGLLLQVCDSAIEGARLDADETCTDEDTPEMKLLNSAKHILAGISALARASAPEIASRFSCFVPNMCKFWPLVTNREGEVLTRDQVRSSLQHFYKYSGVALPELSNSIMVDMVEEVQSNIDCNEFGCAVESMQMLMLAFETRGLGEVLGHYLVKSTKFYKLLDTIAKSGQRELSLFLPRCLVLGGGANVLENAGFLPIVLAVMKSVLVRRSAGELKGAGFESSRRSFAGPISSSAFVAVATARTASLALSCGYLFVHRLWEAVRLSPDPELQATGPDTIDKDPMDVEGVLCEAILLPALCGESFSPLELFTSLDNILSCFMYVNSAQTKMVIGCLPCENVLAISEYLWTSDRVILQSDGTTLIRIADCAVQLLYDEDFKRQCYRKEWHCAVVRCATILNTMVSWGHADGLLSIWANGSNILNCVSEWCYEMKDAAGHLLDQFTALVRSIVEGLMAQRAGTLSYSQSVAEAIKKLKKQEKQLWADFSRIIEAADLDLSETAAYTQYLHYREHLQGLPTSATRRLVSLTSGNSAEGSAKRDPALVYLGDWVGMHEKLEHHMRALSDFEAIRNAFAEEVGEAAFQAERPRIMYTLCANDKIHTFGREQSVETDGGTVNRRPRRPQILRIFARKRASGLQG